MPNQSRRLTAVSLAGLACLFAGLSGTGCVTVAEFRKLERQVVDLQRASGTPTGREELADASAEVDQVRAEMRQLTGRIEVVEKQSGDASAEVRRLRTELSALSARSAAGTPLDPASEAGAEAAASGAAELEEQAASEPISAEVQAYRAAYAAWRGDDHDACIVDFRSFLQTYPASPYADDAAFWMADCHFKQGDYKNAVLRFDDVVRNYPDGNKAADALYRQGESLLKLGPSYHEAAKRAFQRVLKEYPDSARAAEARGQLKLIEAG